MGGKDITIQRPVGAAITTHDREFIVHACNGHDAIVGALLNSQAVLLAIYDETTDKTARRILAEAMDRNTAVLVTAQGEVPS